MLSLDRAHEILLDKDKDDESPCQYDSAGNEEGCLIANAIRQESAEHGADRLAAK